MALQRQVHDVSEPDHDGILPAGAIDRESFGRLYETYGGAIFRFCNRRLNDDHLAAEAASTIFSKAWAAIDGFRGDTHASFRAWLFTIAHNTVTDNYRRHPTEPIEHAAMIPEANIAYLPAASAEREDSRQRLRWALAQLPDEQRRIVELRLAGLNGVEIAEALGKTHSAIKSSQFRAYTRLRELLATPEEM